MQILGNIWGRVRQLLCISKSEQTGQLPPDESTNERITKCPTNASNTPSPLPQHRPELCLFILKAINPNDNQVDSPRHEDIPPAELKPAIIESEPSRLIVILDALASCCVSEVEQQVVAISLSMTATKSTVFVAQNSDVPDAVLQHIQNMWKKICAIGQTIVHDPNHPPNEPCPDPNRTDETTKCEQDLRSAIYHFCWSKFRKRVTKRKIRYRHFVKNMRLAGKLPPEFEKFDELFDMVFALCTKNDKAIVVSRMISSIASDFHSLLRDLTLQETLENEYLDSKCDISGFVHTY
jgi:translation initiation factor 1 (eIF-1/SUI1)